MKLINQLIEILQWVYRKLDNAHRWEKLDALPENTEWSDLRSSLPYDARCAIERFINKKVEQALKEKKEEEQI